MIITTSSIENWDPCIPQEGWLETVQTYFLTNVVNFQSSGSENIGHITSSWQHTSNSIEVQPGITYAYSGSIYDYSLATWMTFRSKMTCSFYHVETGVTELIYKQNNKVDSPRVNVDVTNLFKN